MMLRLDPPVPTGPPINSAPNPYRTISGWFKMPEGRAFGSTGGVAVDKRDEAVGAGALGREDPVGPATAADVEHPVAGFDVHRLRQCPRAVVEAPVRKRSGARQEATRLAVPAGDLWEGIAWPRGEPGAPLPGCC